MSLFLSRRRSSQHTRRRLLAAATSAVLGAGVVALVPAAQAQADTAPLPPVTTPTVSADVLPTVQVNGVIWDEVTVGDTVYATGSFTTARPAGSAPGTNETPRSNILAFDITTGALSTTWAPSLDAQGLNIAASPDGKKIFVVGDFTSVNAITRRKAVELDATTGAVVANFNPNLDAQGRAVAVSGDTVYLGGTFSTAGGAARSHLAAFSVSTGALTTWAPTTDQSVLAITAPPGSSRIVVGGKFTVLNATAARGLGALDATTGATLPFPANQVAYDYGPNAGIYSLTNDGTNVYATGFNYLVNAPTSGGNFESVLAADVSTGNLVWVSGCRGDTYDAAAVAGVLYAVSHAHDCSSIGANPEMPTRSYQYAMAFQTAPAADGRLNNGGFFSGRPAPEVLHWFPTLTTGTYTGQTQAAWTVTGNSRYVVLGGEFPKVNGVAQQGLVRFAVKTLAPNKEGPQGGAQLTPTLVSLQSGRVRVSWQAAYDRDNRRLTYEVLRGASLSTATVVATLTQDSAWFSRPTMFAIDQDAPVGSTQTYRVRVKDPFGNTVVGATGAITVPAGGTSSVYASTVLGDGASHLWRLGEGSGSLAYDYAAADDLTLGSPVTRGAAGAMMNDGTALSTTFSSSAAVAGVTPSAVAAPQSFAEELWFSTTSTSGGKLLGYGDRNNADSGSYDRHIYMTAAGNLVFGVYPGGVRTLTTPKPYNDGQWHHVVANLGSGWTELYVDGKRIASDASTTSAQTYSGYWRIGGDNLNGWPNQPSTNKFSGSLEDIAIYPAPLTSAQVQAHYTASGRTFSGPTRPADAYGAAVWDAGAALYWRLDDAAGSATALDRMTNEAGGTYSAGVVRGEAGAPANPSGSSIRFPGTGTQALVATNPVNNPTVWSAETWFSTTTTSGGRLIGFGNSSDPNGTSSNYDRYVYMLDDGTLRYGIWTGAATTLTSPATYNDGTWHHVVATHGPAGMQLFVDGTLVASGPAVSPQGYTGYWRLGTDNTWGGASSNNFAGSLDEAAVYTKQLSASTVAQHYQLGKPATPNQPPTAAFTSSTTGLKGSFDASGSSDPDGTIASYGWQFGDGSTGTGATPTHTYAAAGSYDVVLTVTDDKGASGTATKAVTVTQPPNVPPTAAFSPSCTHLACSFDGSASADSDGTLASYAWSFGDTGTATGATAAHTYAAEGSFDVTLTVTDNDGATDSVTKTVTVAPANVAPVASFASTCTNLACSFDGSGSSDSDGTVASYAWDLGDGHTSTTAKPAHTYASAGTYTVVLTVTDDKGATASLTRLVSVTAPTTTVAADAFGRTVASGFGSADTGGAWTVSGTKVTSSVDTGSGRLVVPVGSTGTARLGGVANVGTDVTHVFWTETMPTGGGAYLRTIVRGTAAGDYFAQAKILATGAVQVSLSRSDAQIVPSVTLPGLTYTAGTKLAIRVQATGSAPTTLRVKVWPATATEPTAWTVTTTDSTAGYQVAGSVGVSTYVSGSATAALAVRYDDLVATGLP